MTIILLISPNDDLLNLFTAALPAPVSLMRMATLAIARAYIETQTDPTVSPTLIIFDSQTSPDVATDCRLICQDEFFSQTPLIVLIARLEDREAVLAAGADDFLLMPLLPAEISIRLINYLHSTIRGFNPLVEAMGQITNLASSNHTLNQGIKSLADIFNAASAWLVLLGADETSLTLLGSFNLPPLLQQNELTLCKQTQRCLEILQQGQANLAQVIPFSEVTSDPSEPAYLLSIPLRSGSHYIGLLNLAYHEIPQILRTETRMLARLGQEIGRLLDMLRQQQETQAHATETAFIVLIARVLGERLDLKTSLSLTLEQAVPLLNASAGDIWLLSADKQWLELASSLTPLDGNRPFNRQPRGQGLVGWVVEHGQLLHTPQANNDLYFDPQFDQIEGKVAYAGLITPLRHRDKIIGALAIYNYRLVPFSNQDITLLEGIASVAASAIANIRLVQELRDYVDQLRILYEMSQQIGIGLDLQTTLERILYWLGRLFDVEIGLLWLTEPGQSYDNNSVAVIRPVVAFGLELSQQQATTVAFGQKLVSGIARSGEATIINDLTHDPRLNLEMSRQLGFKPRNVMIMPMTYRGEVIGVVSLINKIGGPFIEADLTLLSTAVEMMAVAVGNARLHSQTVGLMAERERLHQQILQTERLAIVGRLTASLSHEINNPMQAIQGALTLALEEMDNPEALSEYLHMGLDESQRIVQLINRMRQIYRLQSDKLELLDLNNLLEETIVIARKELKRQKVTLQTNFAPNLPLIMAISNQLHIVFLSYILNLSDASAANGGGELELRTIRLPQAVQIKFLTTHLPIDASILVSPKDNLSISSYLSFDIITAHGGAIECTQQDQQTVLTIQLPLSPP